MDPASYNSKVPHQYDTERPDEKLLLASPPGVQHRLVVYLARGARRKIRIAVTIQQDGHPEFPKGVALYLEIDKDVVIPLWAIQPNPIKWDVAVHYDQGGEQVVYEFQTKDQALRFQSLVTGYDVVQCYRDIELAAVHHHEKREAPWYKFWKEVSAKPELRGRGEVQIWQRRGQATALMPAGTPRADTTSLRSGPSRRISTTTTMTIQPRQPDTVTIITNRSGQQLIFGKKPDPPVAVAFLRNGDENIMLKIDLSQVEASVTRGMLHLKTDTAGASFSLKRLVVTENSKASWDICTMGVLAKKLGGDILKCKYLTIETQSRWPDPPRINGRDTDPQLLKRRTEDAKSLRLAILGLKRDYEEADLLRAIGQTAARNNDDLLSPLTDPASSAASSGSKDNSMRRMGSNESLPGPTKIQQQLGELDASTEHQETPELQAIPAKAQRIEMDAIPEDLRLRSDGHNGSYQAANNWPDDEDEDAQFV